MPTDTLRFSRRVPPEAINLAWIEIPDVIPENSLSLVETGRYVAENRDRVWLAALDPGVQGTAVNSQAGTGNFFFVTYNPVPTASGALASGTATYAIGRTATAAVSPSGFVVQNFTSQIRVYPPIESRLGTWGLRVQDGVVVRQHVLQPQDTSWLRRVFDPGDELVLFHSVPEMSHISYLAEGPSGTAYLDARVLDVSGVIGQVLDDHSLQLPNQDLVEILQVWVNAQALVRSASGQLYAEDGVLPAQLPPRGPFSAWDPRTGALTLTRTLHEADEVVVNYRYREALYFYEGYSDDAGNPHNLGLDPAPGQTYDVPARPTSELLNVPVYLYLLPTAAYRLRTADGVLEQERKIYSGLRWTKSFLRWERTAAAVAVDPVLVTVQRRSTFGFDFWDVAEFNNTLPVDTLGVASSGASGLATLPSALVLAKIYVTPEARLENVQVIDTRVRGGGIPEGVHPSDPGLPGATVQEIKTYWDFESSGWDGQPVPLAGVLVVELPRSLLTGANGFASFTQAQLQELAERHVAAGVRVLLTFID